MSIELAGEIRIVLTLNNNMTPEDVRRVVFDRRIFGLHKKQSIKTFKNVMAKMPDVETYLDANGIYKRRLIKPTFADRLTLMIKGLRHYYEGIKQWSRKTRN